MEADSHVLTWATAISTNLHNDRRIIFRFAQEFSPAFDRNSQPVRVIIVWRYQSDSGQPSTEDYQRMNLLEDTLDAVLNANYFSTLALVSTGEELREWTYYAESEDGFMSRLNYALAGMEKFPIEIHIEFDPQWTLYEKFTTGIKKPPIV
jgi:hypothetical protein